MAIVHFLLCPKDDNDNGNKSFTIAQRKLQKVQATRYIRSLKRKHNIM